MKKEYRPGVFIVTYRKSDNKIFYLILKRKLHWKGWEFPKGGINNKKQILEEVKRELKEETGQILIKVKSFNVSGKYYYDKEYKDRPGFNGQTYLLFSAEIKNERINLDNIEHSGYKWLEFEKAWAKLKWPNQRICLRIVNKDLMKK